jgi:hypothetical protein
MEPDYQIKKPRPQWTMRERVLLIALVVLSVAFAVALGIEKKARHEEASRAFAEATGARAYMARQLDTITSEQIRHKDYLENQINGLADKVHELERRCAGGDKGGR